jgi:hypothetical protein
MPAKAVPPPKPELPPNQIRVAGKQEHFQGAGIKLAAQLGWEGESENVTVGVRVDDAQNWLTKSLHEQFQAGAFGKPQPEYTATCAHLSIDDPHEQELVDSAFKQAYEAGKGASVETVDKVSLSFSANLILPLTAAAEMAARERKAE